MRPIAFWTVVAVVIFVAMTVLWAFADEPSGAVEVIATVLWWGSGLALIVFGLVAIFRWKRPPATSRRSGHTGDSTAPGTQG